MHLIRPKNLLSVFDHMNKNLDDYTSQFDDFFHFHGMPTIRGIERPLFSPSLDFIENEKEYNINIELPGINQNDIELKIDNDTLIIKGEKKYEKKEENQETYVSERFYGSFRREIPLPKNCNAENIDAIYEQGVLNIKLPKIEEIKQESKTILIKAKN